MPTQSSPGHGPKSTRLRSNNTDTSFETEQESQNVPNPSHNRASWTLSHVSDSFGFSFFSDSLGFSASFSFACREKPPSTICATACKAKSSSLGFVEGPRCSQASSYHPIVDSRSVFQVEAPFCEPAATPPLPDARFGEDDHLGPHCRMLSARGGRRRKKTREQRQSRRHTMTHTHTHRQRHTHKDASKHGKEHIHRHGHTDTQTDRSIGNGKGSSTDRSGPGLAGSSPPLRSPAGRGLRAAPGAPKPPKALAMVFLDADLLGSAPKSRSRGSIRAARAGVGAAESTRAGRCPVRAAGASMARKPRENSMLSASPNFRRCIAFCT